MDYGSFIPHESISNLIGVPYKTDDGNVHKLYTSIVSRAKKKLLEQRQAIQSIHGKGYRVIMPDGYVKEAHKHFSKAVNFATKGQDHLTFAPSDYMSKEGYKEYRVYKDQADRKVAPFISGVQSLLLTKKQHPFDQNRIQTR